MYLDEKDLSRIIEKALDKKLNDFYNRLVGEKNIEGENPAENMTLLEVANYLEVSRVTIQNWIKGFKIESFKRGNARYFKADYIKLFKKIKEEKYIENMPSRKSPKHPHNTMDFRNSRL